MVGLHLGSPRPVLDLPYALPGPGGMMHVVDPAGPCSYLIETALLKEKSQEMDRIEDPSCSLAFAWLRMISSSLYPPWLSYF